MTTVESIQAVAKPFVFSNANAAIALASFFDDLANLTEIAWPLFLEAPRLEGYCQFWHNRYDQPRYARRMEQRMAEFLVHECVPLAAINVIGVRSAEGEARARRALADFKLDSDDQGGARLVLLKGRFMGIEIAQGDLLEQRVDAIVNTVNTVGVMGKGIALQFKRKWPANTKAYEAACKQGEVVPGRMFVFDNGGLVEPKFIINFPTKRHWRQPSRMADIEAGLVDLVAQVKRLNIKSIAIPPLGCGNGGLDWAEVRPKIEAVFRDLQNVDVRLYAPNFVEGVRELVPEVEKPKMTPGRAAILKLLSIYREMMYPLSQIEVQKLAYFLTRAGQDLGTLKFRKYTYGPYAPALRHVLTKMDGAYLRGVGDGTRPSEITVVELALDEAEAYLSAQEDRGTAQRVERIARLIDGFETPYGMELLGTVHWAATEAPGVTSIGQVVSRVHDWNARKRKIMTAAHIKIAHERLVTEGWCQLVNSNAQETAAVRRQS